MTKSGAKDPIHETDVIHYVLADSPQHARCSMRIDHRMTREQCKTRPTKWRILGTRLSESLSHQRGLDLNPEKVLCQEGDPRDGVGGVPLGTGVTGLLGGAHIAWRVIADDFVALLGMR